jgi:hypothetical protein
MTNNHNIEPLKVFEAAQIVIFKTLWDRLPNKSFISGLWLRSYTHTPLWMNCFCYVLPTTKYHYLKYYFGNIILCTPGEKGLWEQATEEERISYALDLEEKSRGKSTANWDAVKEMEIELKILYQKYFPITYKGIINYHYPLEYQKKILNKLNKDFWNSFKE